MAGVCSGGAGAPGSACWTGTASAVKAAHGSSRPASGAAGPLLGCPCRLAPGARGAHAVTLSIACITDFHPAGYVAAEALQPDWRE